MAVLLAGVMIMTAAAVDLDGQVVPGPSSTATVSSEVIAAAAEAQVEVVDLLGAMSSSGASARRYLIDVGELPSPAPPPSPVSTVWDRLAQCESTGRWNANTGNGFFGGIQFDYGTWLRHGGGAYAPRADLASRAQQITIGERTQAAQGWGAWPACSRRLGLR